MKKILLLLAMVILGLSLAACAAKAKPEKKEPIRCPACGYEGLDYIYKP